jgi:hypothetical protein
MQFGFDRFVGDEEGGGCCFVSFRFEDKKGPSLVIRLPKLSRHQLN